MEQSWTHNDTRFTARVPAHVLRYAELIGLDATADLLLQLGGAEVVLSPNRVHENSLLVQAIGREHAMTLGKALGPEVVRLPIGNTFLCRYLRGHGVSVADIARRIRLSNVSVRRHLDPNNENKPFGGDEDGG